MAMMTQIPDDIQNDEGVLWQQRREIEMSLQDTAFGLRRVEEGRGGRDLIAEVVRERVDDEPPAAAEHAKGGEALAGHAHRAGVGRREGDGRG